MAVVRGILGEKDGIEMVRRSLLLGALALPLACSGNALIDGATNTATGGRGAAGQGAQGGGGTGGALSFGGFAGGPGGTTPTPWEHSCSDTGIEVDGAGPALELDEACPEDYWAAQHYDGAVAYDTLPGFVGHLDLHACTDGGARQIHLSVMVDGTGLALLTSGRYVEPGQVFELSIGEMEIAVDGDVGDLVIGRYEATFGPQGGSGEPLLLSGAVRACHLPDLALP